MLASKGAMSSDSEVRHINAYNIISLPMHKVVDHLFEICETTSCEHDAVIRTRCIQVPERV